MTFLHAPKLLLGLALVFTVGAESLADVPGRLPNSTAAGRKRKSSRFYWRMGLRLTANRGGSGGWCTPPQMSAGCEF